MRVISVPARLRLATSLLFLCVPLAAIETIYASRAPWWRLPYRSMEIWSVVAALIFLPIGIGLASGRKWALRCLASVAAVWCLLSAWFSIRTANFPLGFFTLFLAAFWVALHSFLEHELSRSFFDPRMQWFQGLPRAVPGLTCEFASAAGKALRVSRIDEHGAFVFSMPRESLALAKGQAVELVFKFNGSEARAKGAPVRALDASEGAGILFGGMTADDRKKLADFVETLRGQGHA